MSDSNAKPVDGVRGEDWLECDPGLHLPGADCEAHSVAKGADCDSAPLTDNQKASIARTFEAGLAQTAGVGPYWAPLFSRPRPRPESPKDIDRTDSQLEDAADRRTFGSFSSDWMLWNKNELESAMAIDNSSYPASSIQSPIFPMSYHDNPFSFLHHNSPPFSISRYNSPFSVSRYNSPPFSVSRHNSPPILGSHHSSPLFYSSTPGADHRSSVKIRTSASPFQCHYCDMLFLTEKFLERHHCKSFPTDPQFNTWSSAISSDRGSMWASAVFVPESLEKKSWDCPHPTCNRKGKAGFHRVENLIQHSRSVHNNQHGHVPARGKQLFNSRK